VQGRLYCIDQHATKLPSAADPTFLKEKKFVNFFWRRLIANTPESVGRGKYRSEFPFVSPCGKELNYVKPADCPIVFHTLLLDHSSESPEKNAQLLYAHDLAVPFRPEEVFSLSASGRLYHPAPKSGVGLISSGVGCELGEHMIEESGILELGSTLVWDNKKFTIPSLNTPKLHPNY